jgi:hypothetical protein
LHCPGISQAQPGSSSSHWLLLDHACIFKHVGPFPARTRVAVFEVLAEVVGAIKLLGRIALAKFVSVLKVPDPLLMVLVSDDESAVRATPSSGKFFSAIAAHIGLARSRCAVVECAIVALERRARPAVPPNMERVLVSFGFVLILEAISAE